MLRGPAALAGALQLNRLRAKPPVAVLDELHKYRKWKTLLKGFFDTYGERAPLIVTGSSRLDIFRRGTVGRAIGGGRTPGQPFEYNLIECTALLTGKKNSSGSFAAGHRDQRLAPRPDRSKKIRLSSRGCIIQIACAERWVRSLA